MSREAVTALLQGRVGVVGDTAGVRRLRQQRRDTQQQTESQDEAEDDLLDSH